MNTDSAHIPTESFFVANERIMAAVCGGQLTTDHVLGLSAFHAPAKDSHTLIQSTRLLLVVDGQPVEAFDDDVNGAVVERGFVKDSMAVRVVWRGAGLEVEDTYFIPPALAVVVQHSRIRNISGQPRRVKLFAILYPQLGSPIPHKKGLGKEACYHRDAGCVLVEDLHQNVLVFGLGETPTEFQVGEVCRRDRRCRPPPTSSGHAWIPCCGRACRYCVPSCARTARPWGHSLLPERRPGP